MNFVLQSAGFLLKVTEMKGLALAFTLFIACLATSLPAGASVVAWWPLDNDGSDASGNGHDAVVVGTGVSAGQPGANAATGQSTDFTGNGHLDVPCFCSQHGELHSGSLDQSRYRGRRELPLADHQPG